MALSMQKQNRPCLVQVLPLYPSETTLAYKRSSEQNNKLTMQGNARGTKKVMHNAAKPYKRAIKMLQSVHRPRMLAPGYQGTKIGRFSSFGFIQSFLLFFRCLSNVNVFISRHRLYPETILSQFRAKEKFKAIMKCIYI